ncbi:MAG: sporulation protein YunB [Clostridia bacterium]|nr:sporulation protein YunB [Clostridia bacterium]
MRYQKHYAGKRNFRRRLVALLAAGMAIFAAVNYSINPILKKMTAIQAAYIANIAIDRAAAEVLAEEDISYGDLIRLSTLSDGTVSSMSANIREMNRFKTEISKAIQQRLLDCCEREVSIPIGTLTGIDLFSGRGVSVRMKIQLYGNVTANLRSEFDAAGINQTRHQIICDVKVGVSAIIPGCSSYTEVENSFTVSETVILGSVPDSFTNVETGKELYDDINNYIGD